MGDEREQQIRERLAAAKRFGQSNGFGLSADEYRQWVHDWSQAHELTMNGGADLAYLLDALDAAREENGRLREALARYGRHQKHCAAYEEAWPCECGWDDALAALARGATDAGTV